MKGYAGYILILKTTVFQICFYFHTAYLILSYLIVRIILLLIRLSLYFQTGASLQQRADGWKEKVMGARGLRPRTPTYLNQETQVVAYYACCSSVSTVLHFHSVQTKLSSGTIIMTHLNLQMLIR